MRFDLAEHRAPRGPTRFPDTQSTNEFATRCDGLLGRHEEFSSLMHVLQLHDRTIIVMPRLAPSASQDTNVVGPAVLIGPRIAPRGVARLADRPVSGNAATGVTDSLDDIGDLPGSVPAAPIVHPPHNLATNAAIPQLENDAQEPASLRVCRLRRFRGKLPSRREHFWTDGADGIYLFNFFCPREGLSSRHLKPSRNWAICRRSRQLDELDEDPVGRGLIKRPAFSGPR